MHPIPSHNLEFCTKSLVAGEVTFKDGQNTVDTVKTEVRGTGRFTSVQPYFQLKRSKDKFNAVLQRTAPSAKNRGLPVAAIAAIFFLLEHIGGNS